ncbi:MAG: D-alanyl-D-alanine carboxypeptidase/D-alanyl-D-alanine-endopeptidase [Nocardioides sp.]|nr:D-alanyl-D-alanine carboxypeptidase/D-alanyl-D-alanine-endopeptidase [Nocardioides sp.]
MKRGGQRRSIGLISGWLPVIVVLLILAASFAAFEYDAAERLGLADPEPDNPAEVAPPEGLELPELAAPRPVARALSTSSQVDPAKVEAALAPYLDGHGLGKHKVISVGSLDGNTWFDNLAGPVTPASTMKLLTGTAAIESLGAATTFDTRVVRTTGSNGSNEIVLVGAGDPYLTRKPDDDAYPQPADLQTLAAETAASLKREGVKKVRLGFDDSMFTGGTTEKTWPANYTSDAVVAPITALWVDQGATPDGWGYEQDPSLSAATMFAQELRSAGIKVQGQVRRTSAGGGAEVAKVESPPVEQIVDEVLAISDNEGAELLAHHIGIAEGFGGTFEGGVKGTRKVLRELGVPLANTVLHDGSGLSREDRLTGQSLLAMFRTDAAPTHAALRPVITGLPVAAFNGSLAGRLGSADKAGRGRVRAKTGTLTGVHGLAGVTTDLDGNVFAFVFIADKVKVPKTLEARATLDDLTAALASCHCSA